MYTASVFMIPGQSSPFLALLGACSLFACASEAPAPHLPSPPVPFISTPALSAASAPPAASSPAPLATPALSVQTPPPSPPPATPPSAEAQAPSTPPAPTLTSIAYTSWIWATPKASGNFIGYIRVGQSIPLRSETLVRGEHCRGGFYQVLPHGYICNDRTVSRTPDDHFTAVSSTTKASNAPFPYRYAISGGAPMYNRLPTQAEQARFERKYGPAGKWKPLIKTLAAHEDLAIPTPIEPSDSMPSFIEQGMPLSQQRMGLVRETIPHGSMLSFTRAFQANGRTFLLSADHTLIPADRVRLFRPSSFQGVRLGGEVNLPLAWMRKTAKPKYKAGDSGHMEPVGSSFPVRSWVMVTGNKLEDQGKTFLETKELHEGKPVYAALDDVTLVEQAKKRPLGVAEGQKWIHVRITQGTLVAYEDLKPVYATLMSPGAGGVPIRGADPVKMSTTPTGTYYVTFKDRASTMSPDKPGEERTLWISDVPYVQYFNPPFAIHAAYWHERFGEPTSAGCVNVSPMDAHALFHWSDPPVPEHWQGATGSGASINGPTTAVVVTR